MMLYEFLDMSEADSIVVYNKPYNDTFFLLQIDNGNIEDVNSLIYDAIESCDVHNIAVDNNTLYIYLDEDTLYVASEWDEDGMLDFYELGKGRANEEMSELARSLGIYIM